jgi:hypothetical protein
MQPSRQSVLILDLIPAMQRHADYARRGYVYAVTGEIPADKALSLVRKFDSVYGTRASRRELQRAKGIGWGRAVILLYSTPAGRDATGIAGEQAGRPLMVGFTLLVTAGDHPVHYRERPILITEDHSRLRIGDWELVRRTRAGQATPAWTWAMQKSVYQQWRERLLNSARGDMTQSPQALLVELYGSPGFAGARSQVGHLVAWYRRCWRRYRGKRDPFPQLPRLYYVQRLKNSGYRLGRKS